MKRWMWISLSLLVLILFAFSITYFVNQTEHIVLTRFGKALSYNPQPGLHFKMPLVDKVHRIDNRIKIYEGRLIELLTKDKKNIVVQCYVTWQVEDPLVFFSSVETNTVWEEKLDDILTAKGGAAVGDFEFDMLFSTTKEIMIHNMESRIQKQIAQAASKYFGVKIIDFGVSRLALPNDNAFAVYERMRAERKAIANKYRAEGQEKAAAIIAAADREKSDIISEAYQNAQIIRGEGDAEAAKIYSQAFSKDPDFYQFWRTLESYHKILDEKSTLVLTEDSELFKYLRQ
ncbi:MAG: protease modulator HflC [Deltaproteobacteria bacterium]|nr:protease modulator HflC [Deltaproteobacteria bacterium]